MVDITQTRMDSVSHLVLMPITLLINFSLCQYLMATFYSRRHEPRIKLLLACSILGFLSIIPFSTPNNTVFEYLDDISETASTLTFVLQIVILGRDINRKVCITSLVYMTRVAEAFVAVELVLILASLVRLCDLQLPLEWLHTVTMIVEDVALWFIFFARFYYIAMAHGLSKTIATKRVEIILYLLYATHAYPFVYLEFKTHISWQPARALCHRLTLMLCILHTIRDKIRSSKSSRQVKTGPSQGTRHSDHPTILERKAVAVKMPASQRVTGKSTMSYGPSMRSVNRVGVSFRSIAPISKHTS